MLLPVLLAVAPIAAPVTAPTFPPLSASEFQTQVGEVLKALEKGDFAAAKSLTAALPKLEPTLVWDDRKVAAATRPAFAAACTQAILAWRDAVPSIKPKVSPSGTAAAIAADIKVSFEPTLAADPNTNAPAGIFLLASDRAPRFTAAYGLQRGEPLETSQPVDIYNDVLMTIGRYYGIAPNVAPGGALSPAIPGAVNRHGLSVVERTAIRQNVLILDFIQKAIENKTPVKFQQSSAEIGPGSFEGEALQGEMLDLEVEIANHGNGPLAYRLEGDCGCMVATPPGSVPAQGKVSVKVNLDTKEFTTVTTRNVRVYTNDPKEPVRVIPVSLNVKPRYRFLVPGGEARNIAETGTDIDVYLVMPEGGEFNVRAARLAGVDGKVTFEKWEGMLPDPARGEPETKRKGYRFKLQVPKTLPSGRAMLGLSVATDSLDFPAINHMLTLQKGAVATPEELFFGDLAKLKKSATILVTRPGSAPLKILSATTDARSLKAVVLPGRNDTEAKIRVEYDGTAPSGDLSATITLKLDDPKQPELLIPITATVR